MLEAGFFRRARLKVPTRDLHSRQTLDYEGVGRCEIGFWVGRLL
jgi:hypothetical protein